MGVFIAPLALLIERLLGYPPPLISLIGHPVIWVGALISLLERQLNRPSWPSHRRKLAGVLALTALLAAVAAGSVALTISTGLVPFGWMIEALLASTLLAQKELGRAVAEVARGLRTSLVAGRQAVSHIVGRDPEQLDEAGVSRAAVESLSENASDGVIAPLFWLVLLGLPGIALYKAINTADSMIGHLDERYAEFGWASAKLDDVVNWMPSRMSAGLIAMAALLVPGASPSAARDAARRDARKHRSPNAGWPESAMAGALGLSLGGPRSYGGQIVDLPALGSGRRDLDPTDIESALQVYRRVLDLTLVLVTGIALLAWWLS